MPHYPRLLPPGSVYKKSCTISSLRDLADEVDGVKSPESTYYADLVTMPDGSSTLYTQVKGYSIATRTPPFKSEDQRIVSADAGTIQGLTESLRSTTLDKREPSGNDSGVKATQAVTKTGRKGVATTFQVKSLEAAWTEHEKRVSNFVKVLDPSSDPSFIVASGSEQTSNPLTRGTRSAETGL